MSCTQMGLYTTKEEEEEEKASKEDCYRNQHMHTFSSYSKRPSMKLGPHK